MSTTPAPKPLRADAARNREKLLDAAIELFAEQGPDISLEAVAKRAGVGTGTLYRHFPGRDELVVAAYQTEVDHLIEAADELLADRAPDQALSDWLDRFVEYAAAKRGMKGALMSVASRSELFPNTRLQIVGAITRLLDAAIAAGTVRSDVTPEDVLRATGAIWSMPADDPDWQDHARKLLRLLMDGLRAGV